MGLFSKLFGRKKPSANAQPTIKVYDAYGREMEMPREEWRNKILPKTFRDAWHNPDELAGTIHMSLSDGFVAECLKPARQLQRIDPNPHRGATYLAAVLLQLNDYKAAEKMLTETIRQHGEEGVLLTNLAKAQAGRGDNTLAERTLWHALELDPNQENGLNWYVVIHRERGGEAAGQEAMRRIAAIPGSWLAHGWLAHNALNSGKLDEALAIYRECLSTMSKPVPGSFLMQMSGDLGNTGHIAQIVQLVEPCFDAQTHGLQVGNNLIKAHIELGQPEDARRILDLLYTQQRPDWNETLGYWDTQIAKTPIATGAAPKMPLQASMVTIASPIWLKPDSPIASLFPRETDERLAIAFLGSSRDINTDSDAVKKTMTDAPGRMTRSLPLFLAETVEFQTNARTQTLVPLIHGEFHGFMVQGPPWTAADAAEHARINHCAYIAVTHLKPNANPWAIELRLVRAADGTCLFESSVSFPETSPEQAIPALAATLIDALRDNAGISVVSPPPLYQIPQGPQFGNFLLRLEQLLAVRCTGIDGAPPDSLTGVHEIINGNLQLCLAYPHNIVMRILLAQTLSSIKHVRPEVLSEFQSKIALLQKQNPLSQPAQDLVQQIFDHAFAD